MAVLAGTMLLPDATVEAHVVVDGGRAVWQEGPPEGRADATGWIVPTPVNAHTHGADAFLRDEPKPTDVASLVGPGGWKHQRLAAASPDDLAAGFTRLAAEMEAAGTSHFLDFREGGIAGVRLLRGLDLPVAPVIYGRPADASRFDEEEAGMLLAEADGIGLSGMRDMPASIRDDWADACHRARKPLAIHVSEDRRDDVDAVLALDPHFVVHLCKATPRDLDDLAAAGVTAVVCPRSNAHFGLRPPVRAMLQAGLRVAVGTDNGMLSDGDVLAELRAMKGWSGLDDADLLRMATWNGRGLLGLPPSLPPRHASGFMVVPPLVAGASGRPTLAPRRDA